MFVDNGLWKRLDENLDLTKRGHAASKRNKSVVANKKSPPSVCAALLNKCVTNAKSRRASSAPTQQKEAYDCIQHKCSRVFSVSHELVFFSNQINHKNTYLLNVIIDYISD